MTSIETEIKQKTFRNEFQKASLNLIYSANWLMTEHKIFFAQYGLTPQQYNVLRILRGSIGQALSTSDIRERMVDKNSDSSRIVDKLHRIGLISRKVNQDDKRFVAVSIAKKGLELLTKIDVKEQQLDDMLSKLTHKQAQTLNQLLNKMRDLKKSQPTHKI